MNRRNILSMFTITALALAWPPRDAFAQQGDEWSEVWVASNRFHEALAVLDNGEAMEKVWAHTNYVTYVGPGSRSIIVGWEAQKKYWADTNKLFSMRNVKRVDWHFHGNGNVAWEMSQETRDTKMKDGASAKIDYIVTNVYERLDGRWLMVSHHAQPKPQ